MSTSTIRASIILLALLVLISCGKPPPPRDFSIMAALVKVGMTKEEVIQAIGKPDMNSLEDPELSKKSKPGVFLFAYHDGLKSLMVSFQEEKVVRVNNLAPPPELEKQIRDTGVNP